MKSGKWGRVGDLKNTGLQEIAQVLQSNPQQSVWRAYQKDTGHKYATQEDVAAWAKLNPDKRGYASGGTVQATPGSVANQGYHKYADDSHTLDPISRLHHVIDVIQTHHGA